jgi:ubiquinol-cytochrome c reductase cytochrome b subunit
MRRLWSGFDERTGLPSALDRFLRDPVPSRGGWLFTLGSLCLFLLGLQFATGGLLATAYAPTPDHARASVSFIEKKMAGGSLARGLHSWGASALIVIVLLHMARVFAHRAYRNPRQENWWSGLLLFLFVLGFAFTGYLLPWDQKGYWATVVAIRITATAPLAGPYLARLLAGGPRVGAPALTRFAAIHFVFLPAVAFLLAAAHVYLLRRHGHAGLPGDKSPREPFYPRQLARDATASLAALVALIALAHFFPAPLEATADPSDASYVPRPDWYFLFLFQLLHYFKGKAEIIGTILIPTAVTLFLLAIPLLDRTEEPRRAQRRILIASGGAIAAAAVVLTWIAASESPARGSRFGVFEPPPPPSAFKDSNLQNYDLAAFPPSVLRGGKLIASKKCLECHKISGDGNAKGLELKHLAGRRPKSWLIGHFKDPQEFSPHSKMPPFDDLPERDLSDMADYLLALP